MEESTNFLALFDKVELQKFETFSKFPFDFKKNFSEEKKVIDDFQNSIINTIDFICLLKTELSKIRVLFKENPLKIYEIICQKKKELCETIKRINGYYQIVVELNGSLMVAHQKGGVILDELTNQRYNLKIELEIFEQRLEKDQDELQQLKTLSITQETEVETAKSKLTRFTDKLQAGVALGFIAVVTALHIASPESVQSIPPDAYKQINDISVLKMTKEQREKIDQMLSRRETLLEIIETEKENVIILKHRNYQVSQELKIAEKMHVNQKAKLASFAELIDVGCNLHSKLIKLQSPLDDILNIYETNIESNNKRYKEREEKMLEEKIFKSLENAFNIYNQCNLKILLNSNS